MSSDVDNDWCRRRILFACRGHDSLEEAAVAGIYIERVRNEVIEHCIPYAHKICKRTVHLPDMSRVDPADLESAAVWGLTEGVGCYKLSKNVLLTTHITNWIRKRVLGARYDGHWAVCKPPREYAADYMAGRLDPVEREAYIDAYIKLYDVPGDDECDAGYSDRFDGSGKYHEGGL